jgi:virulence factor
MENLINRFKRYRTIQHIEKTYKNKYAFIGMGNHSINNLYPVLDYLNADIKYVITKSEQTAKAISANYSKFKGTNDLEMVLNDDEISGVFVSANPKSHFDLIKKILLKDKNVFVEKPPCYSKEELLELIEVEKNSKGFVLVGFQKRYAPLYSILKQNVKNPEYYSLKYVVGNYPEGDALLDLFIHPLDVVSYLFGEAKILSFQNVSKDKGVQTFLIHLEHKNKMIGNLELSTDYWWAKSYEEICVNTDKKYLKSKNTEMLTSTPKPQSILSIPMEKIKSPQIESKQLYEQNNFLPAREQNQLYSSGYFDEIKTFLDLCEGRKANNKTSLNDLVITYELINEIQKKLP